MINYFKCHVLFYIYDFDLIVSLKIKIYIYRMFHKNFEKIVDKMLTILFSTHKLYLLYLFTQFF